MNKNIRIMYVRDESNNPIGCLAIRRSRLNKWIKYNFSLANKEDIFEKDLARFISLGRLEERPKVIKMSTKGFSNHDITREVFSDILANSRTCPGRLRKFVKRWLAETALPEQALGGWCQYESAYHAADGPARMTNTACVTQEKKDSWSDQIYCECEQYV